MTLHLHGVFANLPTSFADDGSLDLARLTDRIEQLISAGIHGFSTQLSAGEFAYLSAEERVAVTSTVLRAVQGRAPVLVGVSGNNTAETLHLAKHAQDAGATAVMVMPRSYFKLRDAEVLALYEEVGRQVACPLGIYNNPFTTGIDISSELYARVQDVCNVLVTKDGAGDLTRISDLLATGRKGRMAYLCGTEFQVLLSLLAGADGCCNAINSVVPRPVIAMYDAYRRGELDRAREVSDCLQPLYRFVRVHGVARTTKCLADLLNSSYGPHRRPLQPLTPAASEELAKIVARCGFQPL